MPYSPLVTLAPPSYARKSSAIQTCFSTDSSYVLVGHSDSTVSIYNARQNQEGEKDPIASYGTSSNVSLSSLSVSPSSETFVTAGLTPGEANAIFLPPLFLS